MSRLRVLLRWLADKVDPVLRNATFRLFVRDWIEAFLIAFPALGLAFPNSLADLKAEAIAVAIAAGAAVVAAVRRVIAERLTT